MTTNENCKQEPIEKLCEPGEAALLWDEYKYRHDLIWKHLIRSTVAVIILITVPYSTKVIHNKFLIWGSSIVAFIYLYHTFSVIMREHKLLERVKILYRKRQMHYLELPSKSCLTFDSDFKGNFLGRIVGYLILLLLLVVSATLMNILAIDSEERKEQNTSLKHLSNSKITITDLIQSNMTLDELISRIKKNSDAHNSEKTASAGLEELTAAIEKLTNAINQQGKKISDKSEHRKSIEANDPNDPCSKLESFLRRNIDPIYFEFGEDKPKGDPHESFLKLKDHLDENSEAYITIEGHTDSTGTDIYNFELGQKRAYAIKNILTGQSVSPNRIFIASYGEQLEKLSRGDDNKNQQSRKVLIKAARIFEGQCVPLNRNKDSHK